MIEAIVKTLSGGYPAQQDRIQELGFKIGDRFEVRNISMGQSSASIYLVDHTDVFNSIFFRFEENGEELNIYADDRFNPYI